MGDLPHSAAFCAIEAKSSVAMDARTSPDPATNAQDDSDEVLFPSSLDFAIPTAAAQTALGISPSLAESPAGVIDNALSIINDPGESGLLETGFSYTGTLATWGFERASFNWVEYTRGGSLWRRRNTHLSMALVRGATSDDPSMRGAVGLSIPLFDDTDWRMDVGARQRWLSKLSESLPDVAQNLPERALFADFSSTSLQEEIRKFLVQLDVYLQNMRELDIPNMKALVDSTRTDVDKLSKDLALVNESNYSEFQEQYRNFVRRWDDTLGDEILIPVINDVYSDFRKHWDKKYWNAAKASVSTALTWFSPDDQYSNLKQDGNSIWANYSNSIGTGGQYSLFGRYYNGLRKWNDVGMMYDRATGYQLGVKVLMAGSPSGGFFVEYLFDRSDRNSAGFKNERTIQIGFERKLSDGFWLQIALGSLDDGTTDDRSTFGMSFNYNIGHSRTITTGRGS